jgi:hypothetical protein
MKNPKLLALLRSTNWSDIPSSPGVYWWYFPREVLTRFQILEHCDSSKLRLQKTPNGKVCLYHGMAKNLAERIEWHAAQKLTLAYLKSGWLSTFRFTLLALNNLDFHDGSDSIDRFFDGLDVSWKEAGSRDEAVTMERNELKSKFHYPLNISGNPQPELKKYLQFLRITRRAYKQRSLEE